MTMTAIPQWGKFEALFADWMPPGFEPGVEWADDTDAADTDDTDAIDDDKAAAEELEAIEELTESRMVVSVIKI